MTPTNTEALTALLVSHGRADDLNAMVDDKKRPHSEREAIEGLQNVAMKAAAELRRLAGVEAERDALRAELESERQWGRLWYFVCDEAPLAFEKIVCEHTPSRWIQEAHKLRAAMKGTQ